MVLIPALPLLAALLTAALGPRVLKNHSHLPAVLCIGASFVCAAILLWNVYQRCDDDGQPGGASYFAEEHTIWTWAAIPSAMTHVGGVDEAGETAADSSFDFVIDVTLRTDPLTAIMLVMVTFVATLVALYGIGYMHDDPGYWRFFTYVSLFVFSMTMLVSVSNFALLYVFWEAVGVCSYLLIGFWYKKPEASAAGMKAFLVNRVGDFGFALGVFLIWTTLGTLNFHDTKVDGVVTEPGVFGQQVIADGGYQSFPLATTGVLTAICLLLFVGACGKSAQFPLHVWLPDAMEGPTPVSALIHAATMVTAGVYMVARCTPLFVASGTAPIVVACIGCFTAIMAGFIAITQTDLKRILAYSTVSQLGYMFLALGTATFAGVVGGMFHLFTHAFFKACLFLGAGSVMHAMGGVIDIRRFGGLRKLMPITHITFLLGCLALAGVVPFAGFWSKDLVLAAVHEAAHGDASTAALFNVLYWVAWAAALFTAFYTFRAFFCTFYGEEKIPEEAGHHAHESPKTMTIPLIVLGTLALVAGLSEGWFMSFLGHTPSLSLEGFHSHDEAHGFNWTVAITGSVVALLGIGGAAFMYLRSPGTVASLTRVMKTAWLYQLSYGKLFFDQLYNVFIIWPLRILAHILYVFDLLFVDGLVNLVGWVPRAFGAVLRPMQIGLVQFYALAMVLGLLVLIGILLR